jgi:hypothetical protein
MYEGIYEWLQSYAGGHNIHAQFHMNLARRDNGWLYIPVYIEYERDPYNKASLLQDMEDAFNDQEPTPDLRLLLIPAAN